MPLLSCCSQCVLLACTFVGQSLVKKVGLCCVKTFIEFRQAAKCRCLGS